LGAKSAHGAAFAGTADYASPEQCEERTDLDARADVYAIGVLLFRMVTGTLPFTGSLQEVRDAHISVRPPRPSRLVPVNPAVEAVILRALAKNRARRFSGVFELKTALLAAL